MKKVISIEGMHCQNCEKRVFNTLSNLDNVKKVKVNLKKKEAIIEVDETIDDETIVKSIASIGFEVTNIK
ncbi:MAG: heavy-metal-associated domain-containing protein [Bacilli bacterium]